MKEFAEQLAVALLHNPFGESVRGQRQEPMRYVTASSHGCCTLPGPGILHGGPGATIKGSTCFDSSSPSSQVRANDLQGVWLQGELLLWAHSSANVDGIIYPICGSGTRKGACLLKHMGE